MTRRFKINCQRIYLPAIFFTAMVPFAVSGKTDTTQHKRVKVLPVPSFGYSPETGTYIGAVALLTLDFYRDTATRTSNAKVEFNYTWRKQVILESEWDYFFNREKWYTQGLLRYSKFPDLYYGIGEATAGSAELLFESNRLVADINALKKVANKTFIGPRVRYLNYTNVEYNDQMPRYHELNSARVYGGGITFLKDTRNNLLNASKGMYLELSPVYNSSPKGDYAKAIIDVRGYRTIFNNVTVAGRVLNEANIGSPPFYDYALIGGDNKVRGYYFGRYREKNLFTVQAETRSIIVWRIGFAVFGGATKLYPDIQSLSLRYIKTNYGAGIRFLIDRKQNINLRFDYAMTNTEQTGFYVSFGESF